MRIFPARSAGLAALLVVGGCVSPPAPQRPSRPQPVPVFRPAPPPAPAVPQSADWRDWPVTPGDWTYRSDVQGSIALFGRPGAEALLTLRCDRGSNAVYLSRRGAVAAPFTLRTTSLARTLPVRLSAGEPDYAVAALAPRDSLLDAMAFSRGRFLVEQAGVATLVVPAWAEVARVTEDCRR